MGQSSGVFEAVLLAFFFAHQKWKKLLEPFSGYYIGTLYSVNGASIPSSALSKLFPVTPSQP
jgi:hypothetical protein